MLQKYTKSNLYDLIELPKITDARGSLSYLEGENHLPFQIKRIYYLYDVPTHETRGGHAHFKLNQALIALAGSFEVSLCNGCGRKEKVLLNSPNKALIISNLIWRDLTNFSADSICLVLASEYFDETDYIRDYQKFIQISNC